MRSKKNQEAYGSRLRLLITYLVLINMVLVGAYTSSFLVIRNIAINRSVESQSSYLYTFVDMENIPGNTKEEVDANYDRRKSQHQLLYFFTTP